MIANFNWKALELEVKSSPYYQFGGFGDDDNGDRPSDFHTMKDLFFRWLNATPQGDTLVNFPKRTPEA